MKNHPIMLYLMASLAYYQEDSSILRDGEYDNLCRVIHRDYFLEKKSNFDSIAKILPIEWLEKNVTPEDLQAGTGYQITDYPDVVHQELKKFRVKNKL